MALRSELGSIGLRYQTMKTELGTIDPLTNVKITGLG
jgi:hypothetical protein